ncbi:TetR/AcrR family transcriptional regulator [Streptomyces sp. NPDC002004]
MRAGTTDDTSSSGKTSERSADTRERILVAAAELLAEGGSDAVSTRAVAQSAGVQAPTLYRLFGDKQGLLDAVTAYGFERYLESKQTAGTSGDPVVDLRRGWDLHIEFGLTHPSFYVLMYGAVRPGERPAAGEEAHRMLIAMLERVARSGRLRLPVDEAAAMIQAASVGVVLTLVATPVESRDTGLANRTRDVVLSAVTTDGVPEATDGAVAANALALSARLPELSEAFTPAEAALLREWLRRLAASGGATA